MDKHCMLLDNCQSDSRLVCNRCTRSSITDIALPKFHLDIAKKSFYYLVHPYLKVFQLTLRLCLQWIVSRLFSAFYSQVIFEQFFKFNLIIVRILFFILYKLLNNIQSCIIFKVVGLKDIYIIYTYSFILFYTESPLTPVVPLRGSPYLNTSTNQRL